MAAPETEVATRAAAEVAELTLGTNIFDGPRREVGANVPVKAVFCSPNGGPAPTAILNTAQTKIRNSNVFILVRSEQEKFTAGILLARAVRDAVHYAPLVGFIDVRVEESEPNYLGQDDARNHEWSMNVNLNNEE